MLYHITFEEAFRLAERLGEYRSATFAADGFIHCSYASQVSGVANRLFRACPNLVLLEIDPSRLSCRVVDENLEGGTPLFPHVYGPLPLDAVRRVHPFPCGGDGGFALPPAVVERLARHEPGHLQRPTS